MADRLRLRQVAVVTRDSATVEEDLREVLGLQLAHRYEGVDEYGLGTSFWPVGDEFVEVVVAARPGTAADRFIDRRSGPGGFIVMIQCADLAAVRTHLDVLGCRVVDEGSAAAGSYLQIHPGDTGGTYLQLVEPADDRVDAQAWLYGGAGWRDARSTELVDGLLAAELQTTAAPAELAAIWSRVLDRPSGLDASGRPVIELDRGELRFVAAADGRGNGLGGVDLAAVDRDEVLRRAHHRGRVADGKVVIAGLRIDLRATSRARNTRARR